MGIRNLSTLMCCMALIGTTATAETVSTESLLKEMTDLKRLAEFPKPAYTCRQFSSYDRASTSPDHPDTWFANGDAGQFIRMEEKDGRKEWVMADVDGPGTIVRFWSANPAGTVRIYLDGSDTPTIACPMWSLLVGTFPGLPRPISGEYGSGRNLYFPIPYAKHLKVTSDAKNIYYHINYRTYENGTTVQSFQLDDLKRLAPQISHVAALLDHPKATSEPPEGSRIVFYNASLADGEEKELITIDSDQRQPENAIAGLRLILNAPHLAAAARGVVLIMKFDDEQTVECPAGDFFGLAPGFVQYASLPMGVADDGPRFGWSHWWMPFRSRAVISAKNWSGQPVTVNGKVALTSFPWDDDSLLFHAKWRIQRDILPRPFIDWTHLEAEGKGRFVGGHLHLINPVKKWWGEGDEKIYVDGEKFPSTFGTGTEDYYGYAWGCPDVFNHAYHNQTRVDGPDSYGNTSNNRWHIFDDIPFTTHLKFDMEQWAWDEKKPITRAAVSYWYARPGGKDAFGPITKADVKYIDVPPYQVHLVPGAIEAESLVISEKSGGNAKPESAPEMYSGERILRWSDIKTGDRLSIMFESPETGKKHVSINLVRDRNASTVKCSVNHAKAGADTDLLAPRGSEGLLVELGECDLKEGPNTLTVEVTGRNAKAVGKPTVGIDYVLLK